jgi:DNA-binding SARP family transcriptional activator
VAAALAETLSSQLDLALLRAFELRRGGERIRLPLSTQRLVALLALRNRPLHRLHVAGTLWLDASEERAGASLRTAVWRLRRLDRNLLETTPTHIGLGSSVTVDVHETIEQAQRLLDPDAECDGADLLTDRLSAELLPDWYDDWVLLEQERFRQVRLHALEALCERLTKARRFGAAVEAGVAAVAAEPLRESAQRVLMSAYIAEGNTCEAIRQYCTYRRTLRKELGLEPSQLVRDLLNAIPDTALAHAGV